MLLVRQFLQSISMNILFFPQSYVVLIRIASPRCIKITSAGCINGYPQHVLQRNKEAIHFGYLLFRSVITPHLVHFNLWLLLTRKTKNALLLKILIIYLPMWVFPFLCQVLSVHIFFLKLQTKRNDGSYSQRSY